MAQGHFTLEDAADTKAFILHGKSQEERPGHILFHEPIVGQEIHDLTFIPEPPGMNFCGKPSIADMSDGALVMFRKDGEEAALHGSGLIAASVVPDPLPIQRPCIA